MRFSTTVPVLLAAAPAVVSAVGTLGFALGDTKATGGCKTTQDYEADLDALKGRATLVRGYDTADCDFATNILPAIKSRGFKIILGIWPETALQTGSQALQAAVSQYGDGLSDLVYAVTVGSEAIYRKDYTSDQLNDAINSVKKIVPNIKVGTADSYTSYTQGSMDPIIQNPNVGILLANGFPYWQGQSIDNATASFFDDIAQALQRVQTVSGSTDKIEFAVGETGWPTDGSNYQAAVPTVQNAQSYWKGAVCGMLDWGVNVFAFEAFDEPLKANSTGLDGISRNETHWGVYDASRTVKYDVSC